MSLDTLAGDDDVEGFVLDKVQQGQLRAVLWEAIDSLPGEQPGVIRNGWRWNWWGIYISGLIVSF